MAAGYCPKCYSRLFPFDIEALKKWGVCSYCVSYDPEIKKMIAKKGEKPNGVKKTRTTR